VKVDKQRTASIDRWASRRARAFKFLRDNGILGVVRKIREAGLRASAEFVVRQVRYGISNYLGRRWDRKYGVDTGGQIDLENLEVVGPNRTLGHAAVSVSPRTFRFLARYFPKDTATFTFVDIGSGKGRALLLASEFGFRSIIGVEFSGLLCSIARRNIEVFEGGKASRTCSVVHDDAIQFALPLEKLVLFLANPFREDLWPIMAANIVKSHTEQPRKLYLVIGGTEPWKIEAAAHSIMKQSIFRRIGRGTAPYYLDAYLPYSYEIFETIETEAPRVIQ
jgi:SAM-dependent methyltransferase